MTLRKQALIIFRAAVKAADPVEAVLRSFRLRDGSIEAGGCGYRLRRFDRIFVIGAGKASAAMAKAVERVLGRQITGGLINVKYGHTAKLKRIELNECGHPDPDEAGVRGAVRIAAIAEQAGERDLVICVISGGASALLPAPAAPVTLAEKQAITRLLLNCGADIREINAVRKHISSIKGGQLARLASPATVISLLLSDVIGDSLDVIGSGPTVADASTFAEAQAILRKYGIDRKAPASVRERIERGMAGEIPGNTQAWRPGAEPRAKCGGRQQHSRGERGDGEGPGVGTAHDGALDIHRRRNTRRGAHACRYRAASASIWPARARSGVHYHGRGNHGDDPRRW
jgi:glycerate 2-kinase